MKSAGEASSTLTASSSLIRGSARRTSSCSGSSLMSMSSVVARQPSRTAVAPPTRKHSPSRLAASPRARMKRRIRSSSASSRMQRAGRAGSSLEADETADERVVARVGSVAVLGAEHLVQALLGRSERLRKGQPEPAKTRGADRDEQGLGRLEAPGEIVDPLADELLAG